MWMVHAGCVVIAGIRPSRTMSWSLESMWWNAWVHRLDLGLYSHPKEFLGNGVRTHVNSKGKILSTRKILPRGVLYPSLSSPAMERFWYLQSTAEGKLHWLLLGERVCQVLAHHVSDPKDCIRIYGKHTCGWAARRQGADKKIDRQRGNKTGSSNDALTASALSVPRDLSFNGMHSPPPPPPFLPPNELDLFVSWLLRQQYAKWVSRTDQFWPSLHAATQKEMLFVGRWMSQ